MSMEISSDDVLFLNHKFNFNQSLVYIPFTFQQEASQFLRRNDLQVRIDNAKEVYTELVQHFIDTQQEL